MTLRRQLKRIEESLRGTVESFELLDGTRYYYDRLETYSEMFLYALDAQLGRGEDWPEPPGIYRKMLEAKDPAEVLERFQPENPQSAFVNVAELYDVDTVVHERRLVILAVKPVQDLSEP